MSFYICQCGAWPITRKNIDLLDYFDLCHGCQNDYDKLTQELHDESLADEQIEIPEFWLDEEE